MKSGAKQGRFLGALMGMSIGDAMGMPFVGLSRSEIEERFGWIDGYRARHFEDGAEIKAGEFTDESELALCIVESFTVNNGELDPENIGARFLYLARGEARRWIPADTLAALTAAEETLEFVVPLDEDGPATGDVAARGIPVGLIHSAGTFDPARLRVDAETVTRITHGSPAASAATAAVAFAVQIAARGEIEPALWATATADFLGGGSTTDALRREASLDLLAMEPGAAAVVASAIAVAANAGGFPAAVTNAINAGGMTDARGAIAGAIAGARWGIAGIPQSLIDDLEGRIYVSLAAPWFFRTVLRRAGLLLDLRSQR